MCSAKLPVEEDSFRRFSPAHAYKDQAYRSAISNRVYRVCYIDVLSCVCTSSRDPESRQGDKVDPKSVCVRSNINRPVRRHGAHELGSRLPSEHDSL
jgi:hypothetical protein